MKFNVKILTLLLQKDHKSQTSKKQTSKEKRKNKKIRNKQQRKTLLKLVHSSLKGDFSKLELDYLSRSCNQIINVNNVNM